MSIGLILGCWSPSIILIPSGSSSMNPLQFQRNQALFISSNVRLNCVASGIMTIEWTILNCATVCAQSMSTNLTIRKTSSELFIPARTLPYGVYELKLTAIVSNASQLPSSASVFVRIVPSGIIANLLEYGTSFVTHGHGQTLTVDPGRYSINPDEYQFNSSVRP
jgi:hypothetical protein